MEQPLGRPCGWHAPLARHADCHSDGEQILANVLKNTAHSAGTCRPSAWDSYQVGPSPPGKSTLLIAGDKNISADGGFWFSLRL
jgi:hypothetical protein